MMAPLCRCTALPHTTTHNIQGQQLACCVACSPMHVLAKLQMDDGPCKAAQWGPQR
jgi:hypothetical protein